MSGKGPKKIPKKPPPSLKSFMMASTAVTPLMDQAQIDTIAEEHVENLLADMDEDNNGYVEREEFHAYVHRVGWPLTEEKIDAMFDEADSNGDGRLDFHELARAASGRFKARIHRRDWFQFVSAVAEMLSGTQNVFEMPLDPPMKVEVQDAQDMAPNMLTFRPATFHPGMAEPHHEGPLQRRGNKRDMMVVVPPKSHPKANATVQIPVLDSFAAPSGGIHGAASIAPEVIESAINSTLTGSVGYEGRADVQSMFPPPAKDGSQTRTFDRTAAVGRSIAGPGASRTTVRFASTANFDRAVRASHQQSERAFNWPTVRPARDRENESQRPRAVPAKTLRELVDETRPKPASSTGQHYIPNKGDTLPIRAEGVMRGGVDDERAEWLSVRKATNEGITPSLELLERRRRPGAPQPPRAETDAEARARLHAEGREPPFSVRTLVHKAPIAQDMRADTAADQAAFQSREDFKPSVLDFLNGKPRADVFREEPARRGRMLASGKPDWDLLPKHTLPTRVEAMQARVAMPAGTPLRLQLTENAHPAADTKAPSAIVRGEWKELARGGERRGAGVGARAAAAHPSDGSAMGLGTLTLASAAARSTLGPSAFGGSRSGGAGSPGVRVPSRGGGTATASMRLRQGTAVV